MATKITGLTASQVEALRIAIGQGYLPSATTEVTATTATFDAGARDALDQVVNAKTALGYEFGRRGYTVASIHGVIRKLQAQVK